MIRKIPLFKILFFLLFFNTIATSQAQTVNTVVGTGTAGVLGDGGYAIAAQINNPGPSDIDKNCNLHFIDVGNNRLRRVDAKTGVISTVNSVNMQRVKDIIVDDNGDYYVSAYNNFHYVVYKLNAQNGNVTSIFQSANQYIPEPHGIGKDNSGNIYYYDIGLAKLYKYNPNTGVSTHIAGNGTYGYAGNGIAATSASLGYIGDIAVDANGIIYLLEQSNDLIRKINTSGIISVFAGTGVEGYSGDGASALNAQFYFANIFDYGRPFCFMECTPSGYLYVHDGMNNRIRKIDLTTNTITHVAGTTQGFSGDNAPLSQAQFATFGGMAIDKFGNLFISDIGNHRIRMGCMNTTIATVSVSASPGNVVCTNTPVVFTATTTAQSCYVDYKWYKIRNGNSPAHVGNGTTYTDYAPLTNDQVYCEVSTSPNPSINSFCKPIASPITSNTITMVVGGVYITGVDINTKCVPGFSFPPVTPKFSISIEGGTNPITYTWTPLTLNNTTLSSLSISNPEIMTAPPTGDAIADYDVAVSDNSGCPSRNLHVQVKLTTEQKPDMALKDSHFDLYNEPNNQQQLNPDNWNIWMSPDVWNRLYGDLQPEHQDAKHSDAATPNADHYRLRNVGCITSQQSSAKFYWTMGGMPETWPADWTTSVYQGTSSIVPQGKEIPSFVLNFNVPVGFPSIPPSIDWIPPKPSDYFAGATAMDICFLTRLLDGPHGSPLPMTFTEVPAVKTNILNNNNIATRNFRTVRVASFKPGRGALVVGTSDGQKDFSLEFINQANFEPGASSYLHEYLTITVSLGDLFDVWVAGGTVGTYSGINHALKTVTFDGTNTMRLDNIHFEGTEQYIVEISFDMHEDENLDHMQMPEEIVHFRQVYTDASNNEIVYGNFSYQLKYDPEEEEGEGDGDGSDDKNSNTQITPLKGNLVLLNVYPNPAKDYVVFECSLPDNKEFFTLSVIDINGREVHRILLNKNEKLNRWDTRNISSGVYVYKVLDGNKTIETGKVIISK